MIVPTKLICKCGADITQHMRDTIEGGKCPHCYDGPRWGSFVDPSEFRFTGEPDAGENIIMRGGKPGGPELKGRVYIDNGDGDGPKDVDPDRLTPLDHFAMAALPSVIALDADELPGKFWEPRHERIAAEAYAIARAMMAERAK